MATENEKIARKTLVVQEVLNSFLTSFLNEDDNYTEEDSLEFQKALIKRGYLVVAL